MSCGCGGGCSSGCTTLKGDQGNPGSAWYDGSGAPAPNLGIVGDYYLNTANGDVYHKTATSTWTVVGNIKGAAGAAGTNGTTVLYDNWTGVQNGAGAGFVDLKTTGSAIPIAANSSGLYIQTGFTVVPAGGSPLILLRLLFGAVNLYGFASAPVASLSINKVDWEVQITRIDDLNIRFKSWVTWTDTNGIEIYTNKYFTTSNQAVPSLTTGSIIKTAADGQNNNDVTCEYLKVLSYRV